jgi:spermidine synthase
MNRWELLDTASVPSSASVMSLMRRGHEFAIWVNDRELMASRAHGSEDALAELAFARLLPGPLPERVLIGGLGMGFTLAAALSRAGRDARVVVAELVPAVVTWNQGVLGPIAGHPLLDPRVSVWAGDVAEPVRRPPEPWDLVLLDVDNGPRGLTRTGNDWLYSWQGLESIHRGLSPRGVLGVWSAAPDPAFERRLGRAGFLATEHTVRSRGARGGSRHTVWIASRRAVNSRGSRG